MGTEESEHIRVLIANLSGVLAEYVIHLVRHQPDMKMIGLVNGSVEVLYAMKNQVDVLILGTQTLYPPPGLCSTLLSEFPSLKIVVLSTTEERAIGYWLDVQKYQLPTVSADMLVDSIRQLHAMTLSL
jgi:hypothetical protein